MLPNSNIVVLGNLAGEPDISDLVVYNTAGAFERILSGVMIIDYRIFFRVF